MGWAVLLTQPNRERTVEEHARQQEFEVWFPRISPNEVLFPRYGFVNITGAWRALLSTLGVSDVLRSGPSDREDRAPVFVPSHTPDGNGIEDLRARERNGFIILPPRQRFAQGEPVHVDEGLFVGWSGLYDGMPQEGRAAVLLAAMGQWTRVELNDEALSPA